MMFLSFPFDHEAEDGKELLCCLGLLIRTEPELIACAACGRVEVHTTARRQGQVDLFKLVADVRREFADPEPGVRLPIQAALAVCRGEYSFCSAGIAGTAGSVQGNRSGGQGKSGRALTP